MSNQFGYDDRGNIDEKLEAARNELSFLPGYELEYLQLPSESITNFEPSQLSVIVHTMFDAVIPIVAEEESSLTKCRSFDHEREKYPDYEFEDLDVRLELKGYLYEERSMPMKETTARREPSARFREGPEEIEPGNDLLFVVAWHIEDNAGTARVQIDNYLLLPAIDVALARDEYLLERDGHFEDDHRPMRLKRGKDGSDPTHYAYDDNFGKLNRIPHPDLEAFLNDPTQRRFN
jgi:hypothetical protein